MILELTYFVAHCGLRDVQIDRGSREASVFRNPLKRQEPLQGRELRKSIH
jgi:hypothetical protein